MRTIVNDMQWNILRQQNKFTTVIQEQQLLPDIYSPETTVLPWKNFFRT